MTAFAGHRAVTVYQVDAFTKDRFTGNPAGVVLDARGLSDDEMQRIAFELGNSESVFLFPAEGEGHDLRIGNGEWKRPARARPLPIGTSVHPWSEPNSYDGFAPHPVASAPGVLSVTRRLDDATRCRRCPCRFWPFDRLTGPGRGTYGLRRADC